MGILADITNFVGGGLFKEIKDTITTYYPPELSPLQRAELDLKVQGLLANKQAEASRILSDAATQLDKRIAEQEGTASDLQALGWVGKPIVFLRGVQRPLWGYATLYMDFQWFFKSYTFSDQQHTALIIINVLVLGFLFGERAVLNLQPLIEKVFAKPTVGVN
jgi:hypothetical protein